MGETEKADQLALHNLRVKRHAALRAAGVGFDDCKTINRQLESGSKLHDVLPQLGLHGQRAKDVTEALDALDQFVNEEADAKTRLADLEARVAKLEASA